MMLAWCGYEKSLVTKDSYCEWKRWLSFEGRIHVWTSVEKYENSALLKNWYFTTTHMRACILVDVRFHAVKHTLRHAHVTLFIAKSGVYVVSWSTHSTYSTKVSSKCTAFAGIGQRPSSAQCVTLGKLFLFSSGQSRVFWLQMSTHTVYLYHPLPPLNHEYSGGKPNLSACFLG